MKLIKLLKNKGLKYVLFSSYIELRKKVFVYGINLNYKGIDKSSYSQYAEDLLIDKILGYKERGTYIDIGANNPDIINNTKKFYKKGWSGINVEPNYVNYQLLCQNRPRDINLNVGIGKQGGSLIYYNFDPDTLSTYSSEAKDKLLEEGYKLKNEIKVKVITLNEIFNILKKNEVDFISIDTEGYDMEVLLSNNWNCNRAKLVCIEDSTGKEHDEYFKKIGYKKVGFNGLNSFFVDVKHAYGKD